MSGNQYDLAGDHICDHEVKDRPPCVTVLQTWRYADAKLHEIQQNQREQPEH